MMCGTADIVILIQQTLKVTCQIMHLYFLVTLTVHTSFIVEIYFRNKHMICMSFGKRM